MTGREFRNRFWLDVAVMLVVLAIGFWLRAT